MGFFWNKKAAGQPVSSVSLSPYSQPPKRGTKELIESYKEAPWLRSLTQRIARGVACANWTLSAPTAPGGKAIRSKAYQFGDREARKRIRKSLRSSGQLRDIPVHPFLDLLACPNPALSGMAALQVYQVHMDLKGEAYWLLERNAQGMPVQFWPLPPHWVLDCPSASRATYRIAAMGSASSTFEVPPSEMLAFRDPDPSSPYGRGTGVAESLGDEIEISEYASKHVRNFFFNRGMPEAIISFEGAQPAQVKEAKENWNREHQGFWNSFRSYFTGSKIQVERLDTSFKDQDLNALRKGEHAFMREVFNVPPEVMGVIENSNRSTIDAAQFIFATGVLVPRLEFLRTELQARLLPQFDDRLVLDFESPVPSAREFQLATIQSIPEAFLLNEIRDIAGLEPLTELDGTFARHASGAQGNAEDGKPGAAPEKPDAPDRPEDAKRLGFRKDPAWVNSLGK